MLLNAELEQTVLEKVVVEGEVSMALQWLQDSPCTRVISSVIWQAWSDIRKEVIGEVQNYWCTSFMRRNSATSKRFSLWDLAVKVFRKDYSLETLQRQRPPQMLSSQADEFWHIQVNQNHFHNIFGGSLHKRRGVQKQVCFCNVEISRWFAWCWSCAGSTVHLLTIFRVCIMWCVEPPRACISCMRLASCIETSKHPMCFYMGWMIGPCISCDRVQVLSWRDRCIPFEGNSFKWVQYGPMWRETKIASWP